jgi:hypothetical protein
MNNQITDEKENAITTLFKNGDVKDLVTESGITAFNEFLKSEHLNEIPWIGTVIKSGKGLNAIRDFFFARKINNFLFFASKSTDAERQKFVEQLKERKSIKAGELFFKMLDKLDSAEKAEMIGKLISAQMKGNITLDEFIRIIDFIEKTPYYDLRNLKKYEKIKTDLDAGYDQDETESLASSKFLEIEDVSNTRYSYLFPENEPKDSTPSPTIKIALTKYGKMIIDNCL